MTNFIKTSTILFLFSIIFQSCSPNEPEEGKVIEEQNITSYLSEKIIETATSVNDYNFYNNNTNLDCNYRINAVFINPQGDYYPTIFISNGPTGFPIHTIEEEKQHAFEKTGIHFTNDDFFITTIPLSGANDYGSSFMLNREQYLDFFEDCSFDAENNLDSFNNHFGVSLSDVNFNCNATVIYSIDFVNIFAPLGSNTVTKVALSDGLSAVKDQLSLFNNFYNTAYTLDDIRVNNLEYISPAGTEARLVATDRMLNYFDSCSYERDINNNDCLNFVYPLEVNRFSLQLNEVITTIIENDEDLITIFNTNVEKLNFVYPISLQGQNGNVLEIETNEALKNTLENSYDFCD